MKTFVAATCMLALIIVGANVYSYMLQSTVERLDDQVQRIESAAAAADWDDCKTALSALLESWDSARKWFEIFIDHREIDLINQTLDEVKGYVASENQEEILVKSGGLRTLFKHIPENEKLKLANIF